MSRIYPVVFNWDGKAMVPLPKYKPLATRQFVEGHEYPLVPLEARSRASHSHYFAALHDYFDNLPHSVAARWPTAEHFRKWCLIESGWFDESEIDCADQRCARQTAVLMRSFDEYARISVHGSKVIIRRAKSQSAAAMTKEPFEKSKNDVLELAAQFVGVSPSQMKREAGRHA